MQPEISQEQISKTIGAGVLVLRTTLEAVLAEIPESARVSVGDAIVDTYRHHVEIYRRANSGRNTAANMRPAIGQ